MDKPDKAAMTNLQIATVAPQAVVAGSAVSIDRLIRAFLNGDSHGEDVLGALYGDVASEPIPERMRALFRR